MATFETVLQNSRIDVPHFAGPGNHSGRFVSLVIKEMTGGTTFTKRSLEKLAAGFGITDKIAVKELTELAIVLMARKLAHSFGSIYQRFYLIVELYSKQVDLSHRTSQSMLLQQYSTPAPIGYLAGIFCELEAFKKTEGLCFEPSAGNGLLTIAALPKNVYVNEIDFIRSNNLRVQGYAEVTQQDATQSFKGYWKRFDAVITNPPFGNLSTAVPYETYKITSLEHLMALRALETMKDTGRAAIIIGGHTKWDELGRIQAGRNRIFFNYLYSRYNVMDVININGKKLYSRQGTGVNVRLILIDGRKDTPQGAAPLFNKMDDTIVNTFEELYDRVTGARRISMQRRASTLESKAASLKTLLQEAKLGETLEAPYQPASNACIVLDTQVPDSMSFETQSALERIRQEVGGDIDNFVRHRLGYPSKAALCKALAAEQIDAVAMAIYNIEARNQGMVIGDQTGIGKGRVAAAIIRYATKQGLRPIFLTEKANLFSDIYRDLDAIGSAHLRPFVVNGRESKTDIKDEDGNIIYQAPLLAEQQAVFVSRELPGKYDFVLATYTQFNSPDKKPEKPLFLQEIAQDNIFILDEAHNSSGNSNTGSFLQGVAARTRGIVFLSATFAKRPDNMPIYAMKTAISDCTMSKEELVDAITRGGVALQEVLSAQLVAEGQMLRRERSFEGVEVNYITMDSMAEEHRAITDNITAVLRNIIDFQNKYINSVINQLDKIAAAEGKETELRKGTSQAGVDNQPYFSKVFQVINQMLFSLKAKAVAERTIMRLKEGKKPVIAFASTMGSFIETLENEGGLPVGNGDAINADFGEVLKRGLDGVLRYTEKDVNGQSIYKRFALDELEPGATDAYNAIYEQIESVSTGITISPIDVIVQMLKVAGYTVAEVTGRKYELQLNLDNNMGLVLSRKKINTNDAFRRFNNNEVDVLMINQSGSTGASAHAIPTSKVPKDQVRQRVMIVLQAELDINTEVQKRGRINRTGQILKPIYDYVTSAIPAEKRLMMMLQKKLKSLDANTTSNQKQSTKILDVPDFLNKYGDRIVQEYLMENPDVNRLLDDPLRLLKSEADSGERSAEEDTAHRVSGRVAVLSIQMQQEFYNEVSQRYNDYVEYLKQIGEYDLEVEAMNLQAETVSARVIKMGKGSDSAFGNDSVLETIQANVLKKPFSRTELQNLLSEVLRVGSPKQLQHELIEYFEKDCAECLQTEIAAVNEKYDDLVRDVPNEKAIRKLNGNPTAQILALQKREQELGKARDKQLQITVAKFNSKRDSLLKILRFFYVGRSLNYTTADYGNETVPAVFLGCMVDLQKKNPFTPSQVKLRFAIASSAKYIAMPASYHLNVLSIMGASINLPELDQEMLLNNWDAYIRETNVDRKVRHIITGNLLQAFSDFKGKLVSYSTINQETQKGILLPEYWNPDEQVADNVTVPIVKALPLIKSLIQNSHLTTNNGLSFFRVAQHYKIVIGGSRVKGGDIYLDRDLLPFVAGNNFQKTSDKMVAQVDESNLGAFVEVLQRNHGLSITVNSAQFRLIEKQEKTYALRKPIALPPPEPPIQETPIIPMDKRRRLELEARALKLKLHFLAA